MRKFMNITKALGDATRTAAKILIIDGCAQECAGKTMELAGFKNFRHLKLAEMGFEKGATPLTDARIRLVANHGAELLAS